ncbi:MAG TPA: type II toxin-antitoxin system VapC family toxin [Solirubrobacterales bacterium]|jgi:predicted nucleic acid-binding protein|nr:type II toxin-antitoxin system VapC family toxin [Solirubrobacterales bacterium]HMU26386.1 type II toxin-antitoxin system VapC family toxin [Solirubrobacterales bacterium]HMW44420.1 type II toxin-antitoxin system VapC family toxin [Solirubrobacterales bacterium]HMY26068.1 type II toxin-antitoxin system VapC family toxin [Solirubrobacterales bacterium]HNA22933.1 type II toxin-antitoxin system VapC family toxin [Solirubrobacterales bacterium]
MDAPAYFDTSALTKLILDEEESPRISEFMNTREVSLVSSQLSEVELLRAVSRSQPGSRPKARELLDRMVLLPITSSILERAAVLDPPSLRSLDAIHLATAVEIKTHLAGVMTYDNRMRKAAEGLQLPVVVA